MPTQAAAEAAQRNLNLSSFEKLPTEILVEIAKHLQDDANFPHIGPPLKYISAESVVEIYWSRDLLSYKPTEDGSEPLAYRKFVRRNQDIRNLTATSSHLFATCGTVIYRTPVIRSGVDGMVARFFERITSHPVVQTYIQHLSIQTLWYTQTSIQPYLKLDLLSNLVNLRSLEIRDYIGVYEDNLYRLLSRLPGLERLSMNGFFKTRGFPILSNIREAYFNDCRFLSGDGEHILLRLPSLKLLSNYHSFNKMPENAFLGLGSTLETLVWVGYQTNHSDMARAISSMKVLKHIKTNNLRWLLPIDILGDPKFLQSQQDVGNVGRTLQTLEFVPIYFDRFSRESSVTKVLLSLENLSVVLNTNCQSQYRSLRIVDVRAYTEMELDNDGKDWFRVKNNRKHLDHMLDKLARNHNVKVIYL
ncbi:hypothetical protein GCG54_00012919 [Colletotrichum gloeosporioides]|uniref:F-box domain-containing protein n=1 Tax=Colletotrichum gloeosporioides TaxID=474922 RepID=A0A8H4CTE3_COLGL|nr:uncharacterized protein GCG54_00012919 [Colletotrichum gloeosporioides]KAF3809632.1 hypothetical protein GCG54_00012919 [Colletotrichum gloeosporioides]